MINFLKGFLIIIISIFLYWSFSFWLKDYNEFINTLKKLDYNTESISNQKAISRFDMTRIINLSDCYDCTLPSTDIKSKLNIDWWNNFKVWIWKNFEEVSFENTNYNWKDYYYCVSYAAFKNYVNWYPKTTSPFCPWKFCWTNNTTIAEFIQVLVNILWTYLYDKYSLNWYEVKNWLSTLDKNSYEYKYFNINDLNIIGQWVSKCWNNICNLWSLDEFNVYIKYCTFNVQSCNFMEFDKAKNWDWPVAELNILYSQWIWDINTINSLDLDKPVDGNMLLDNVFKVSTKNSCTFDFDYDKDGINNYDDTCPYWYNPNQKDTDKDGIWDVCDDDIDWDTIKNPIWIVDFNWNINVQLYPENKDNCLFVQNTEQRDQNTNKVWDSCEDTNIIAIKIWADKLFWQPPLSISFWSEFVWIDTVRWDFWDWNYWDWKNPSHTYLSPWKYTVTAYWYWPSQQIVSANLTLTVWVSQELLVWFQIKWSPTYGNSPLKTKLSSDWKWDISYVDWYIITWTQRLNISDSIDKVFDKPWKYEILANAYRWNSYVASSQLNIWVWADYWSSIYSDKLNVSIWEDINISTIKSWFLESDVDFVVWDFWDWSNFTSESLNISKRYTTFWGKIIKQKIYLKDDTVLTNVLTVFVKDSNSLLGKKWSSLNVVPLVQDIWKNLNFTLKLDGISLIEIDSVVWDFWDWNINSYKSDIWNYLTASYYYNKPWIYTVKSIIYLKNWESFVTAVTVYIKWIDICLWDISNLKCDMDKDGVVDICDDDIDWDTVKNFLWLIKFQSSDCKITNDNIDIWVFNQQKLLAIKWWKIDNCSFMPNQDQSDVNINWVWDICENSLLIAEDTDRDWISDDSDACDEIPENYNWIQDQDWCPEVSQLQQWPSFVQSVNCNQCPCHYGDFWSQLWPWDEVRAVLYDKSWQKIYKYSDTKTISEIDIKK